MSEKSTPPAEEPKMVEKRISHEGFQIKCSKCKGGKELASMKSTTKTVTIGGKPVITEMDLATGANIKPFSTCDVPIMNKVCVPAFIQWTGSTIAEKTLNTEKFIPTLEHSELRCTMGGVIEFEPEPAKSSIMGPKKPNIVDKAKGKINGAANKAVKKATEKVGKLAKEGTEFFDDLKPILENTKVATLANNMGAQLEKLNGLKAKADGKVKELEEEVQEVKDRIAAKIKGEKYEEEEEKETKTVEKTEKEEIELQNEEEKQANIELYDKGVNEAIVELEEYLNSKVTPETTYEEVPVETETPEAEADTDTAAESKEEKPAEEPKKISKKEQLEKDAKKDYAEYAKKVKEYNHRIQLSGEKDSIKALVLLKRLENAFEKQQEGSASLNQGVAANSKPSIKDKIEEKAKEKIDKKIEGKKAEVKKKIETKREELNTKVQAKIDEKLAELGYTEKLAKYKKKSAELQKDIDKAAMLLKSVGDFGGFIDSVKNKKLGKLGAKYKESLGKFSGNLSTLNTSLDGMSYVADGFPKGDVVTKAKAKEEKQEKKEEKEEPPTLPPPILPPPTKPTPPEPEEETPEEETDECTFTKLTAIKNGTLEYVIREKKDEKVVVNKPLREPIQFVAGTDEENKKKLTIVIEGLKRSNLPMGSIIAYYIDDDYKHIGLPASAAKKELEIDINYGPRLMEKHRLALNFMGLFDIRKTKYRIPIEFCSYSTSIEAEVVPDAEWVFMFSLGSDDPRTYKHANQPPGEVFKKHQDKARRVGQLNSKKINFGDRTATMKFLYGVSYNDGNESVNLSYTAKLTKLYWASQKIFELIGGLDKFTNFMIDGQKKGSKKSSFISTSPPSVGIALKHKLVESTTLFGNNSELVGEISLDPVLAIDMRVDLVEIGSERIPILKMIKEAIEAVTDRDLSSVFYFLAELKFNFKLKGTVDSNANWSISSGIGVALKLTIGLNLKGSFWGVEFEAMIEGSAAGSFDLSTVIGGDNDGLYFGSTLMFNGVEASILVKASVTGWFIEQEIEYEYKGVFGKWDEPFGPKKIHLVD